MSPSKRAAFDKWLSETFDSDAEFDESRNCYKEPSVHMAWMGYQAALSALPPAATPEAFDFMRHIQRAMEFSLRTFGPGHRSKGVVDHIRKELLEIEAAPLDLEEWIDVWMLALDGAWRTGATPQQIINQILAKQKKNEGRKWPDWRTADRDKGIEHDRSTDVTPSPSRATPSGTVAWKCAARRSNVGASDPQECNWPVCGCDPYADKVIAALQEAGMLHESKGDF